MSKTSYNISLKGYVGGLDFDRSKVDKELAKNEGKKVNVLIGSLSGSHATGLSISAAFKNHGAAHISIFEWGSLNSDQFSTLIADCKKIKADLEVFL